MDGIEVEFRPFGALERPFILAARGEIFARPAHVEHDPRLLVPAVLVALEEIAEERLLKVAPVGRVEMSPVLEAVALEPLLLRPGFEETDLVAARMPRYAGPTGAGKQRHLDFRALGV